MGVTVSHPASHQLLQIGEAAESVGMSLRTVRYWEEIGLVTPSTRSSGGYRLYSDADLHRLLMAKSMKPLGLTLEEMRELLELIDAAAAPGDSGDGSRESVFGRLEMLAQRVQDQVERIEKDATDARVLLAELRERLEARPSHQQRTAVLEGRR